MLTKNSSFATHLLGGRRTSPKVRIHSRHSRVQRAQTCVVLSNLRDEIKEWGGRREHVRSKSIQR